eukprot:gene14936-biopygen4079
MASRHTLVRFPRPPPAKPRRRPGPPPDAALLCRRAGTLSAHVSFTGWRERARAHLWEVRVADGARPRLAPRLPLARALPRQSAPRRGFFRGPPRFLRGFLCTLGGLRHCRWGRTCYKLQPGSAGDSTKAALGPWRRVLTRRRGHRSDRGKCISPGFVPGFSEIGWLSAGRGGGGAAPKREGIPGLTDRGRAGHMGPQPCARGQRDEADLRRPGESLEDGV